MSEAFHTHLLWVITVIICWSSLMFVIWKKKVNVKDKGTDVEVE